MRRQLLCPILLLAAVPAMAGFSKKPAPEVPHGRTSVAAVQTLKRIGASAVYYALTLLVFEDDRLPRRTGKRERTNAKEHK